MKKIGILITLISVVFTMQHGNAQITSYYYGIFTEYTDVSDYLEFVGDAEEGGHFFVWNGFTDAGGGSFYGSNVISWTQNPDTWDGFGLHSDEPLDFSNFEEGYLNLALKTADTENQFTIGIEEAANPDNIGFVIHFTANDTLYGFERDDKWHELSIPLIDFKADDGAGDPLDADHLSSITILFYMTGDVDISMDEIYYAQGNEIVSILDSYEDNIRIYPNPASDIVHFVGGKNISDVEIINCTGQLVLKQKLNGNGLLNTSELKEGLYFVKLESGNHIICKKLMIR